MRHFPLASALATLAVLCVPALAQADVVEVGQTSTALAAPSCGANVAPANCDIILPEVTALETLSDGTSYPTTIHRSGEIVAFTLGLSGLSSNKQTAKQDIKYLNSTYGGSPAAEVTVLRPVGKRPENRWTVTATSPAFQLQRYLGRVVQFPLSQSLPVVSGERIALTVPTWAPVLAFGLPGKKFAYRQSRRLNCSHAPSSQQAQLRTGEQAHYNCGYSGTRVEYTATEITSP